MNEYTLDARDPRSLQEVLQEHLRQHVPDAVLTAFNVSLKYERMSENGARYAFQSGPQPIDQSLGLNAMHALHIQQRVNRTLEGEEE